MKNKLKKFHWSEDAPPITYREGTSDVAIINAVLVNQQEYSFPSVAAKVVFDIGANIGVTAVILATIYKDAVIHCFEPEQENYDLLAMNTGHLPNVSLHKCGLDNHTGDAMLFGSDDPTNFGGFSAHLKPEKEAIAGSKIQIERMSKICDKFGTPDIIKIDCEGAEFNILTDIPAIDKVLWITGELHGVKDFELLSRLSVTHEIQTMRQFGDKVWHFNAANRELLFQKVGNTAPPPSSGLAVVK